MSRFGDISPAFAAAFGARVDVGFDFGSRKAEARAFARGERRPPEARPVTSATLPRAIAAAPGLPPSRVGTSVELDPGATGTGGELPRGAMIRIAAPRP